MFNRVKQRLPRLLPCYLNANPIGSVDVHDKSVLRTNLRYLLGAGRSRLRARRNYTLHTLHRRQIKIHDHIRKQILKYKYSHLIKY